VRSLSPYSEARLQGSEESVGFCTIEIDAKTSLQPRSGDSRKPRAKALGICHPNRRAQGASSSCSSSSSSSKAVGHPDPHCDFPEACPNCIRHGGLEMLKMHLNGGLHATQSVCQG
jgi:hypothetical protein